MSGASSVEGLSYKRKKRNKVMTRERHGAEMCSSCVSTGWCKEKVQNTGMWDDGTKAKKKKRVA